MPRQRCQPFLAKNPLWEGKKFSIDFQLWSVEPRWLRIRHRERTHGRAVQATGLRRTREQRRAPLVRSQMACFFLCCDLVV